VQWLCADVMDLNIEKESVDFIFFNWLLMYLEDRETLELIEKIGDWLKPNGELFFRESCAAARSHAKRRDYHVNYRTLDYYDALVKRHFRLINEGHIQAYVNHFADPFQCFWHARRYNEL
jgi:SAM-dependent methyltransferase